jgi:predicted Ser/Thr protein kinase
VTVLDLGHIGEDVQKAFTGNKRVLSCTEFYTAFLENPARHARSAAQYLKDTFDHFGSDPIASPRGMLTRYRLFDAPFDEGRDKLVGQEEVQARVYRAIANFVREGAVNRLILLHGPNGSAKSTFVSCLARALEAYSHLDEGALYRFNWVFPTQKLSRGGIGFGGAEAAEVQAKDSYAYLPDEMIDAKLVDEMRDHPLLLLPRDARIKLLQEKLGGTDFVISDYLRDGDLSHKNKQVYEALLAAYNGDYKKVLRHVQVERFYLSRRYRVGAVTVEPQLAVDAHSRQVTMDRSLSALPVALQSLSLVELSGELVDANRGLLEFADLLKRPLEAYKYLLGTVENGRVTVDATMVFVDTVFIGSSNEAQLAVFKETAEFQSFKGRIELVRMPYLLDYDQERQVYLPSLPMQSGKHVAPHTAWATALWAVLTRMRKPLPEKYGKGLSEIVAKLSPLDKAELYTRGQPPHGLNVEQTKELLGSIDKVYGESDAYPNYEGRTGASPRELKTLLLYAAQNHRYACLSPLAVFDELDELCKNVSVYEFLKQEPLPGGYHENRKFVSTVRDRWLEIVDDELRSSMGLVDERQYAELLTRYIANVSHWTKKEKIRNPTTGRLEEPDEDLMADVERTVGASGKPEDHRREIISRIGAWSIEHPGQKIDYALVFPQKLQKLREATFEQRKKIVRKTNEDLLVYLAEGADATRLRLDKESFERVEMTMASLSSRFGYCPKCARDAISTLLRRRYS